MKKTSLSALTYFIRLNWSIYALLLLMVAGAILGFHQSGYEGVFSQFMSGAFTGFQDYPVYGYLSNFLTFRLYLWLGANFPWINWNTVVVLTAMSISIALFLKIGSKQIFLSGWQGILWAFLLVLFFLRDNFFVLDQPHYTMLICTLSLLCIYWLDSSKPGTQKWRWTAIALYLFSSLTRIEAVLPVTALIILLHWLMQKNLKATLQKFYPCLLVLLIIAITLKCDFASSNDYYKRLEPWAEPNLTGGNNLVPLSSVQNQKDSMRYMAATQLLYDDTVMLHETFLHSIIIQKSFIDHSLQDLQQITLLAFSSLYSQTDNIPLSFGCVIIVCLVLCIYCSVSLKRYALVPLYFLCMLAGLLAISFISINTRYILSVVNFGTLMLLGVLLGKVNVENIRSAFFWVILLVLAIAADVRLAYSHYNQLKREEKKQLAFHHALEKKYHGQIAVFDFTNVLLHNYSPFRLICYDGLKDVLFHDAVHGLHINNLRAYFEQRCDCNAYDWSSVYRYFYQNKNEIIFISTPQRVGLKENFLQQVYGEHYYFEKDDGLCFIVTSSDSLVCYRLKRKEPEP